jgi:hypothetical protein
VPNKRATHDLTAQRSVLGKTGMDHPFNPTTGAATVQLSASTNLTSAVPNSSSSGSGINTPALVGGLIGALAFLAAVALGIFFCIVRRTDAMGRPKSRSATSHGHGAGGRSTVEPYKSYDLGSGSGLADEAGAGAGGSGGGSLGRRPGSSASPTSGGGVAPVSLEARFGGGLFGRKKKGTSSSGGGANGGPKVLTNSQRRIMYPGLSIASTQNRSVGAVSAGAGDGSFDYGRGGGSRDQLPASPPVSSIVAAYRDAKRREARSERGSGRRRGSDPSSLVSGDGTISSAITEEDRRAVVPGRRGGGLRCVVPSSLFVVHS